MRLKKNDILFVVALKEETGEKFKDFDLIYTGVGKVNSSYTLTKELCIRKFENRLPKYVLNFGSCGSKKFRKGELVACNKFIQRDMMDTINTEKIKLGKTPCEDIPIVIEHKKIVDNLNYAICGTGDNFATEKSRIDEIQVYDMEAYALAKICYFEKIDFISIKYITDGIDENGNNDWDKEVLSCPDAFYKYINEDLLI